MAPALVEALRALGHAPGSVRTSAVGGGCIHDARRVDLPGGDTLFVKLNERPPARIFEQEAEGLEALRRAAPPGLRVPRVLAIGDRFLALEWIAFGRPTEGAGRRLGEGLAALHRTSSDRFGWPDDNWIGSLRQPNPRCPSGDGPAAFFALRLRAFLSGSSRVPGGLRAGIERFCDRIDALLPGPEERPALLHGDLWGGNWGADEAGRPCIFDPAVHFGCREAELAFTTLFGGFPASFYEAYEASFPPLPDWRARAELWNLYPLLVHTELFGGGYAAQAERILRRHLG